MNPATFLRVLGPEPWNVAYVEPSIRPDDARYGENPNRVGRHHQLQVILKPDPGDPQQLYLDSLAELGIDLAANDIRFVEDNWESPALGAWGLGWEVWLNGLEITQFTYFQQAGGIELEPVSVEITYGLDRILMALQDAAHFTDTRWSAGVTVGDLLLDYEVETSRYYFEYADVDRLRQLFDLYEAEARTALAAGLITVAHDYALKCSHAFNVLDARGAIGVTERAGTFARMRRLSADAAAAYLEHRRELGFPILARHPDWVAGEKGRTRPASGADPSAESAAQPVDAHEPNLDAGAADFVLEIGTEELPAADVDLAADEVARAVPDALAKLRLSHGPVRVFATPRRIAVLVADLATNQTDSEEQVIGPPARAAFTPAGEPTPAAAGFARSAGVNIGDLAIVERGGEERVAAVRRETGQPAASVLGEALAGVIKSLPFGRSMRWNASGATFSRPVRWLLALHGGQVVALEYSGLQAGASSRGLRPEGSPPLEIGRAAAYASVLEGAGITLPIEERRADVARAARAAAAEVGGVLRDDPVLEAEVANLVEQPHAILGSFDPAFLDLPAEVLGTVMKKHQRYFPVYSQTGDLLSSFVVVLNGAHLDPNLTRHGHEAVIAARFADAAYFWRKDLTRPLAAYTSDLERLMFERRLGTMLDKVRRLEALASALAADLALADTEVTVVERAASLCKSDLATSLVVEMTSLQGVAGRHYALRSGEPAAVADAILEHYLPRGAGDSLPVSVAGRVLGLADRLDTLCGLFAVGQRPTGTQDPFGLRRAALGICTLVVDGDLDLDLRRAIQLTAAHLPVPVAAEIEAEIVSFLARRLEVQLREDGNPADAVAAVLAVLAARPSRAARATAVLAARAAEPGWEVTLTAFARCARIVRSAEGAAGAVGGAASGAAAEGAAGAVSGAVGGPTGDGSPEPAERALADAVGAVETEYDPHDLRSVLEGLDRLAPLIHAFFDSVLVMADDPDVRAARLALVARIAALPRQVADLRLMEGY